jgi:hypothetical protein
LYEQQVELQLQRYELQKLSDEVSGQSDGLALEYHHVAAAALKQPLARSHREILQRSLH